jgi:hypothetical protein
VPPNPQKKSITIKNGLFIQLLLGLKRLLIRWGRGKAWNGARRNGINVVEGEDGLLLLLVQAPLLRIFDAPFYAVVP